MKLKKSELIPKSRLGIDTTMKICWNCMFWDYRTGRCPMFEDKTKKKEDGVYHCSYFPWNHKCGNVKWFGNIYEPQRPFMRPQINKKG